VSDDVPTGRDSSRLRKGETLSERVNSAEILKYPLSLISPPMGREVFYAIFIFRGCLMQLGIGDLTPWHSLQENIER